MGQWLSMARRKEITKKYARQYASVGKKDKGRMLDELVGVTGWSRTNARRAITTASKCKGAARAAARKPPAPVYGYDTLKVLIEVWTLIGEPCGKYLAPIMATTLAQLECGTPGPRHECGLRCPRWLCCIGRSGGMVERSPAGSVGEHQFIERDSDSMVDWCVGGDVVVAASGVLDERMTGDKDPC